MSVQQLAPPTLDEIVDDLKEFEKRYGISTVDFVAQNGMVSAVDDDDATEWLYRVEQFRTIQQRRYTPSRIEHATSVSTCTTTNANDVMEQLAA